MNRTASQFRDLSAPELKGQATEAIVKSEFVVRGYSLRERAYDNEPYDFVIEASGEFHRIQAKTTRETASGMIQFETVSTKARSDG